MAIISRFANLARWTRVSSRPTLRTRYHPNPIGTPPLQIEMRLKECITEPITRGGSATWNGVSMRAILLLLAGWLLLGGSVHAGGAACVMAKYQGETLDYALVVGRNHPVAAQEAAQQELRTKGYADYLRHLDVMRAQNLSSLDHAHVIVIRSEFQDARGKGRSAMGCGFSADSYRAAELDAVRDLQAYFWGWKPDQHGYQVVRKFRY